jgi:hypothetical protein
VAPGETFHFDLHLFDLGEPGILHFVETFRELSREGLGPTRGRAALESAEILGPDGEPRMPVDIEPGRWTGRPLPPLALDLSPDPAPVARILVRFLTPTELKSGGALAEAPEFAVLLSRIRDRLSVLRALYGPGPLDIDYKGMAERAKRVRLARSNIERVRAQRRSSRTGRVHSIGGFRGEAEYVGELAEFAPYLRAARWTGVGRQTVWGKGAIEVSAPVPDR